jgi:hypothetical protein
MAIRVTSSDAARHDHARQEILAAIAGRTAVERLRHSDSRGAALLRAFLHTVSGD